MAEVQRVSKVDALPQAARSVKQLPASDGSDEQHLSCF
jgi:hypothetical protein